MSFNVRIHSARASLATLLLAVVALVMVGMRVLHVVLAILTLGATVLHADSTAVATPPPAATSAPAAHPASGIARNATLPAASPDAKQVAYISERDGRPNIFVVNVGTGMSQRLTDTADPKGPPAWSDEGKNIVFTVTRGDTTTLMSVPATGGMMVPIVSLPNARAIRLSNDGQKLAVTRGSWTRNELGVARRDGTLFRPYTDSSSAWYNLAWSPNDAGIAAARADSSGGMQLFLFRAESGRKAELVRMPKGYGRPQWPAWAQDGETILFQAAVVTGAPSEERDVHIHKVTVKNGKILRLRHHDRPMLDEAPSWLGKDQIVFQSNQSGAFELWVMRADGTLAKQLTK